MSKVWIDDKEGKEMIDLLGFTGATLLALCALPEVISSVRKGYCGASEGLLWVWQLGEVLTFIYVLITNPDVFLLANYGTNIALIFILLYYKYRPAKKGLPILSFIGVKDINE